MNNIGHGRMMIFSNKIISMCFEQKQKQKKKNEVTLSHVCLPVTITERECSQSICKIKLLTRALRALGNPASTSVFSSYFI